MFNVCVIMLSGTVDLPSIVPSICYTYVDLNVNLGVNICYYCVKFCTIVLLQLSSFFVLLSHKKRDKMERRM